MQGVLNGSQFNPLSKVLLNDQTDFFWIGPLVGLKTFLHPLIKFPQAKVFYNNQR